MLLDTIALVDWLQRPMSAVRREEKEIDKLLKELELDKVKKADDKIDEETLTQYAFCIRFLCEREAGWWIAFVHLAVTFRVCAYDRVKAWKVGCEENQWENVN